MKAYTELKLIGKLRKPKYCGNCGLSKDSQKERNWVCEECNHKNYKLSLREYLKLRKIRYKRCEKCDAIIKGKTIRKSFGNETIQYKCPNYDFEKESNWTSISTM